jgi:phosphoribosylformimino-5-aminoimidazole carboxamide ribotide isomerase
MTMHIIPAVDIKGGKCVRLLQGRKEKETVFSDDPAAMARRWESLGAEMIHVVDLDGAFEKTPRNLEPIRRIIDGAKAAVQVGGGIRSLRTIGDYLEMGAQRVVIGTEAVRSPRLVEEACARFPERIVVGIDARDGWVAVEGWTETTAVKAVDLARRFEACGVTVINFTDIRRDGMQSGPNLAAIRKMAEALATPVVASGGVGSLADIAALLELESCGVVGIITGKALYAGTLDLKAALDLAGKGTRSVSDPRGNH